MSRVNSPIAVAANKKETAQVSVNRWPKIPPQALYYLVPVNKRTNCLFSTCLIKNETNDVEIKVKFADFSGLHNDHRFLELK